MSDPSSLSAGAHDATGALEVPGWQRALRDAIRKPTELLAFLGLDPTRVGGFEPSADGFPLLVPRCFAARMRKGDPQDPLLLQVLPQRRERLEVPGFGRDPLREASLARDGILKKYRGRVLLIATEACPVHCRYCFRRHFPYSEQRADAHRRWNALAGLRASEPVTEIILSGGDPLSLSNRRLAEWIAGIEGLESAEILRIHTRFPIVVPERVDQALLELLSRTRLKPVLIVHCNHANEIDDAVRNALRELRSVGVQLLNQSVLLSGINDTVDRLEALSRALFDCGVLPYYLHLLDPVAGAAHFDVEESRARRLLARLQHRLPGYLLPRLVREIPGELSKTILA